MREFGDLRLRISFRNLFVDPVKIPTSVLTSTEMILEVGTIQSHQNYSNFNAIVVGRRSRITKRGLDLARPTKMHLEDDKF
jgi:hypothetical protein